jgi:rSAM/selenodomain-associated transferase 2
VTAEPETLVSVVVPVRDDRALLERLLERLPATVGVEVIVSADEADEGRLSALGRRRQDVRWVFGSPGRGVQMNRGATAATGRWLWFVHADSEPPAAWLDEFRRLDGEAELAGGSFAFGLASPAWQARVLEWGVRWRVRLFGLPYGDQGIFVRRQVFEAMGGYAAWPLMEDVEFVRRLNRQGPVRHLNRQVRTSARRWERDGWWRRTARNLSTLSLYLLGVPPERLVRRYDGDRDRG